jgi:hypothetical protein
VWFLAERDTRTNEVLKTELPPASERAGMPGPEAPSIPSPPAA